jgi:imidazolonepropionase-like amidohydrolase
MTERATRASGRALAAILMLVTVGCSQPADLAITDVTVIDPASGRVEAGQTVVIRDGVIESVSATDGSVSAEVVVGGNGRFLIPGLWDMHTHMLVVNGVLNVRDMGGDPFVLADQKSRIASREVVGPTIRGAGSILEDRRWLTRARGIFSELEHRLPVDNPEEARATVAMLKSWGVDLVKVRNVTDRETLAAIVRAAADHGLTVAGHQPMIMDVDEAAELGMTTFEHMPLTTLTMPGKEADEARVAAATEKLVASGTFLNPTLIATQGMGRTNEERAAAIERPDDRYQYLPAAVKEQWVASLDGNAGPLPWQEMLDMSMPMALGMHAAGVPFLAGTDLGVPLTFAGFGLHDELELMVERIGLTPLAARQAATSSPAALFGIAEGSIAPGMAANLVLLDANPLEAIENTRSIRTVILRGEVLGRTELDDLLDWVRENKDAPADGPSIFEQLESTCGANETAACLERLAGYQFSKMLYEDARATYQRALDAGAGEIAIEGLFASTLNARFEGGLDCEALAGSAGVLLEASAGDGNKMVGVLDRLLPALGADCAEKEVAYLSQLAEIEESALSDEMGAIYREHYASFLFKVEGDGEAAYEFRLADMPPGWDESPVAIQKLASWCLTQQIALPQARELAQRAAEISATPIDRLQSMMLEARIASAQGEHQAAVKLMEFIDQAVPNNGTVMGLLETFRKLAAESSG